MVHPCQRDFLVTALATIFISNSVGASGFRANPIRRIVKMLQGMEQKITAEGKEEEATFEKAMCYCKTYSGDLSQKISAAETKIPQVASSLKEAQALKVQIGKELETHKKDRSDAKEAIAKASALREKEAATFAAESGRTKTNIAALKAAIGALEAGTAASFLQSDTASAVQKLSIDVEMSSMDRDMLSSFLAQGDGDDSRLIAPSSEIIGILKQMLETMEGDLATLESTEANAIKAFEALVAAKEKEIAAGSEAIETKLAREGQVGEEIVALKEDLDDTSKCLEKDKSFLADLEASCEKKKAEWETVTKTRAQEKLTIADTIKMLNDDDALDLFKKTLPSPTLLQLVESPKEMKQRALRTLAATGHGHQGLKDRRLSFIALTLRGGSNDFSKVIETVDKMVALLTKEQGDDDKKKSYCEAQFDKGEDDVKVLEQKNEDLSKASDEIKGTLSTLAEEIAETTKSIEALDAQVKEATTERQDQHAKYVDRVATDTAAKDLLKAAQNRLRKFYQPKLYKAAPKEELSKAGRIEANFAGVQVASGSSGKLETDYAPKEEESVGVLELLEMLVADIDKEMQELEVDEKDGQAEYEEFMADSTSQRSLSVESLSDKESAKATLETQLLEAEEDHTSSLKELMTKESEVKDLHLECDWLLMNYETRKTARNGEIDTLEKTKAVLSGADYSFLQIKSVHVRSLRGRHPH